MGVTGLKAFAFTSYDQTNHKFSPQGTQCKSTIFRRRNSEINTLSTTSSALIDFRSWCRESYCKLYQAHTNLRWKHLSLSTKERIKRLSYQLSKQIQFCNCHHLLFDPCPEKQCKRKFCQQSLSKTVFLLGITNWYFCRIGQARTFALRCRRTWLSRTKGIPSL